MASFRVLVTGSSGFIGRHTVNALKANGYLIRTFDAAENNDIRNEDLVRKAVKGVDAVMHFGAMSEVPYSFERPVEVTDVNVTGTVNLLEACRRYEIKKLIFASSSSVYGEPEKLPVREDHPLKPLTPYGLTKLNGEQYINLYSDLYGLRAICLRYFNVYGVGQTRGLVADCLNAIRKGRSMTIFGDGRQTRDFVNIKDVVQANLLALRANVSGAFNVGVGIESSVLHVIRILQDLTGTNSIQYKPKRLGDIRRMYADIKRATRILKYRPSVTLTKGLEEVIAKAKC